MDQKERAKERREKRYQEISLLRTIPYSDHQSLANLRKALRFTVSHILNSSSHTAVATSATPSHNLYRPFLGSVSCFYSTKESLDIDFSNEESKRRWFNRLLYRSKQRGFLELDLVLGKWVEDHIHTMDESGIKCLIHVLDLENPDLWKWLTDQEQPPEAVSINPVFAAVRKKVINNLNSHASPETRATPGQPWVRGWDDFKKGRDGPVVGNQ